MTAMSKKQQERSFVEKARQLYPSFPPGTLIDHEEPDFLIGQGSDRLGIKVTQLFHQQQAAPFPRRQVEDFHQKVMRRARELYEKEGLQPVDVLAYFSDRDPGIWAR